MKRMLLNCGMVELMKRYKLKKLDKSSVYPSPAYKITDLEGKEIGTAYKQNTWKYNWKIEAAYFDSIVHCKSLADGINLLLKEMGE